MSITTDAKGVQVTGKTSTNYLVIGNNNTDQHDFWNTEERRCFSCTFHAEFKYLVGNFLLPIVFPLQLVWRSLNSVTQHFLGNYKDLKYCDIVSEFLL